MPKTILVANDFSNDADAALALAIEMARKFGHEIEIAHVHQGGAYILPPPFDVVSLPPKEQEFAHLEQALAERTKRVTAADIRVNTQILTGVAAEAIVARAEEIDAAMIVIGSRGASALTHVLLGSVAERVVRHAPCPVLVVPHAHGPRAIPVP